MSIDDGAELTTSQAMLPPRLSRTAHILIVDDDATNRLVASRVCELVGATTETAMSGEQAISYCLSGRFDVVLMDIRMPIMDGVETSVAIRRLPGDASQVPILALTGDDSNDLKRLCWSAGMNGFVHKPIVFSELCATIEAALQHAVRVRARFDHEVAERA